MDWDIRYTAHPAKFKLRRGDQVLYFFSDIPYWLVTNSDGEKLLDALDGKRTLREVAGPLLGDGDATFVEEFLQPLVEAEAVLSDEAYRSMKPKQFDVSSVKPGIAVLHVTDGCNLHCKHCYVPELNKKNRREMTTAEMKKVIQELDALMDRERRTLNLLGGEPTLRPDLVELLGFAQECGFLLFVSSNGTKITNDLARALARLDVRFQVSLDGADRQTHEFMRGEGTWERTFQGLQTLLNNGVKPVINMVFHQDNIEQIPAFIDLAKSLKIGARFIPLLSFVK